MSDWQRDMMDIVKAAHARCGHTFPLTQIRNGKYSATCGDGDEVLEFGFDVTCPDDMRRYSLVATVSKRDMGLSGEGVSLLGIEAQLLSLQLGYDAI